MMRAHAFSQSNVNMSDSIYGLLLQATKGTESVKIAARLRKDEGRHAVDSMSASALVVSHRHP